MQIILVVALPEDSDYVFGKLVDTQISISIFLRICKVLNFDFNDLSYIKQISSREAVNAMKFIFIPIGQF